MTVAVHVFDDVGDAATHADGIHCVADAGITSGCDADNYCPDDTLTRGQVATFLYRRSLCQAPRELRTPRVSSDSVGEDDSS